MTPVQKLLTIDNVGQHLKPGITVAYLREQVQMKTPNEAAREMQKAKRAFLTIALQKRGMLS